MHGAVINSKPKTTQETGASTRYHVASPRTRALRVATLLALFAFVPSAARARTIAEDSFDYPSGKLHNRAGGTGWALGEGWKTAASATSYVHDGNVDYLLANGMKIGTGRVAGIHGTGDRQVPMRRELAEPFTGESLFIRFVLRYDAAGLDDPASGGDGEFFVLWLDDIDAGDGANHNPNIPSIGIHIPDRPDGKNLFMVRMETKNHKFSDIELIGDKTYLIVARLSKTRSGPLASFDRLELWVDPTPDSIDSRPEVAAHGRGLNSVRWIGLTTGKKTEPADFIQFDELVLGESWQDVLPGVRRVAESQQVASLASNRVDFRRDVYPILREQCFDCHQGRDADSGHRLDVREEILGHYQGQELVIPGKSSQSLLYQVLIDEDEDSRMPMGSDPLPPEKIAVIRAWIDQGLAWDEKLLPSEPPQSDHWAFQKIRRPKVPDLAPESIIRNPIDAFIAARHRELGLETVPRADRRTLLRRLTLDLTGLPPTLAELEAFLADDSPDAYERVVTRLLASPQYGERWGRHWLDLARWAESDGYQQNAPRPDAWRYRDYVVRSFAANKPYDQFLLEQIAGDEQRLYSDENMIATGFLAAARYSGNELDKTIQRNDILVDIANTTANVTLALTMQCAQCHSHKFDPISARDYYRFQGFFTKGQPVEILLHGDENDTQREKIIEQIEWQYQVLAASRTRKEASLRMQGLPTAFTMGSVVGGINKGQSKKFKEINEGVAKYERTWGFYSPATAGVRVGIPYLTKSSPLPFSLHMLQRSEPVLLIRGDVNSPGTQVDVGWPAVFGTVPKGARVAQKPRTALVDWLTGRDNPLTARVWVNRLWLYHFGRGLVATPDDFGTQGAEPTHPKLLDWLAAELIESDWDTGHIQRLIVESETFRRSAQPSKRNLQIDPDNEWYWRWEPRRLEAEAIRDSMLAVSGLLDATVGGPSVPVKERDESTRRTIYLAQKRGELPYVQQMFDGPSALVCMGQRRNSTVALQSLYLLNDPVILRYAKAFAERVKQGVGSDSNTQVAHAFELALGRPPDREEQQSIAEFLLGESGIANTSEETFENRFVSFCHLLLNLNEFQYIP